MKLPSGREISIDSLADVAEMLAKESFYLENIDEAEDEVSDNLRDHCFSLSGTESPFDDDDVIAIMAAVRSAAEEIGGELAAVMDRYAPLSGPSRIKEMIEKETAEAR